MWTKAQLNNEDRTANHWRSPEGTSYFSGRNNEKESRCGKYRLEADCEPSSVGRWFSFKKAHKEGWFESRDEGTSVAVGNRNEREIKGILGQGQFVEANHLILLFFFDLNKIQTFIISYKI